MSKGKKRCHFCRCDLTNQNRNSILRKLDIWDMVWLDCCHACKKKEEKKQ